MRKTDDSDYPDNYEKALSDLRVPTNTETFKTGIGIIQMLLKSDLESKKKAFGSVKFECHYRNKRMCQYGYELPYNYCEFHRCPYLKKILQGS